jgi:tripartite-type tricarboxylate transporter receptor subunit TctC
MLFVVGVFACTGARADEKSIADFYSKNNVTIAVGFSAGGNYDLYARLLARYLGRHIPGNPNVIVQNMPGAGSRVLANTLYNIGPQDGTMIGLPNQAIATDQATGVEGAQFDARQFHWIGSPDNDVQVAWSWYTSKAKTFDLAKQYEVIVATSGPGSVTYFYPKIMNALLGTKFKLVSGYPGASEMDVATERGEVDGRGAEAWSAVKTQDHWVADGKINVLVQFGLGKSPDLPNVPLLPDLAQNDTDRRVLEFISLTPAMGRPFFMPPKTPADRVAAIRAAFGETVKDPAFLEDAKRARLDISPVGGEKLQQVVEKTLATPKAVLDLFKKAIE